MNKDLMMKAAIQFKGVWPDDSYDLIIARPSEMISGKREGDGSVSYVIKGVTENTFLGSWSHCTRDQFKSFVESLFEGAPEGTTHYRDEKSKWYKVSQDAGKTLVEFWYVGGWWEHSNSFEDGTITIDDLIPRPAKKAEPEAPYMPQVGEECEANLIGHPVFLCLPRCFSGGKAWFTEIREGKGDRDFVYNVSKMEFRPLRTQEEIDTEADFDLVKDAVDMYQACEILIKAGYKNDCFEEKS